MNRFLLIALAAVALPLAACASDEPNDTTVIVDEQAPVLVEPSTDPVIVEQPAPIVVEQPAGEMAPAPAEADTTTMR